MMAYRMRMIASWQHAIRKFTEDRRAGTAMTVGLLSPLVVGAAGLGVDAAFWQLSKQRLQTTADVAAVAGAVEMMQGGDAVAIENAVVVELRRNGFPVQAGGESPNVDVSVAPPSGGGMTPEVKVNVQMSGDLYFSGFFLSEPPLMNAGSKAGLHQEGDGEVCILGLDEVMSANVSFQGTTDAALGCAIASNSGAIDAVYATGNATVLASSMRSHGDFDFGSNTVVEADKFWAGAARMTDPYGQYGRNLQPPLSRACDHNGTTQVRNDTTLQPGRYCGDIRVNNATVTFAPGLYEIYGGDFKVAGTSALVGDGVTFVLSASTAGGVGTIDFAGGTDMQLAAPDDNDLWATAYGYEGVLFYVDQKAEPMQGGNFITNKLLGGSTAVLRGAVYAPSRALLYSGGANVESGCLQLIAAQVALQGNAAFKLDPDTCELVGADPVQSISIAVLG